MIFEIQKATRVVAAAAGNNPAVGTLTVWLFYIAFNFAEAMIETLLFGDHFLHWLDPVFALFFMAFAGGVVWACADARMVVGGEPAAVDVAVADGLCGRCFGRGHEHGVYERCVCPECNGSGRLPAGDE